MHCVGEEGIKTERNKAYGTYYKSDDEFLRSHNKPYSIKQLLQLSYCYTG